MRRLLTIAHPRAADLSSFTAIIAEAVNVKTVELTADVERFGAREVKVNPKLGSRIGAKFKEVLAVQGSNHWVMLANGRLRIAGLTLDPEDFEMRIRTAEGRAAEPFDSWRGVAVLDTAIDPDLQSEGRARDFVRHVQNARKMAGFNITDRIRIWAVTAEELRDAINRHAAYIRGETLAIELVVAAGAVPESAGLVRDTIDDIPIAFRVRRVEEIMAAETA